MITRDKINEAENNNKPKHGILFNFYQLILFVLIYLKNIL